MATNRLGNAARRLLPKNRFARSVSVLAGGTAAGQIIVVAASPVLTRLYSPEDFGLLAVYAGLLGILGVLASLRYQLAIPLPESDEEAAGIVVLSLLIVLGMTALTSAVVGLFGAPIVKVLNTPELDPYLWLIPAGLFLVGVYQIFQYWAIRTEAFSAIAKTKLTQAIGMVIVQIGGYSIGPLALLLGRVFGQSVGIASLGRLTFRHKLHYLFSMTRSDVGRVILRYKNFPLVSIWTGLSSSAGSNLPPILIAAILGPGPAGIFALTHRVLSQPMAVIGKSVGDVFYRQAAQAHREGHLNQEIDQVYTKLVVLALPPAVAIFIIIPDLFQIVFGEQWAEAGKVARWMVPWMFFQFIATPPTRVYPILDKHGIALRFQLSLLFSSIFSVVVGGYVFGSLVLTVFLISVINSSIYLARLMTTYSLVGMDWLVPLKRMLSSSLWGFVFNIPIIGVWVLDGEVRLSSGFSSIMVALSVVMISAFLVFNVNKKVPPVADFPSIGRVPNDD